MAIMTAEKLIFKDAGCRSLVKELLNTEDFEHIEERETSGPEKVYGKLCITLFMYVHLHLVLYMYTAYICILWECTYVHVYMRTANKSTIVLHAYGMNVHIVHMDILSK